MTEYYVIKNATKEDLTNFLKQFEGKKIFKFLDFNPNTKKYNGQIKIK